jgi:Xaa-Pro aminopeptidase
MAKANLITNKTNIKYLTNFAGSYGFVLETNKKSYLFTDSRYSESAKKIVPKNVEIFDISKNWRSQKDIKTSWQSLLKKHRITELGLEENDLTVSRYKFYKKITGKGAKLVNISGKLEKVRAIKNETEIKLLEKSQRINEKVFLEVKKQIIKHAKKLLKKKLTEEEVAWQIISLGHKYGAEDISFDPIVAFGENSASPHHTPGKRHLKKGDTVLIDMGMKYQGYCSDMTRTFFPFGATEKQKEIYNIVLKAQLAGLEALKPGITGKKSDQAARQIIAKAGYGDKFGHSTGHGIGLDVHEWPSSSPGFKEKLKEGVVITVEPGIYLPGDFGVRIEDMALITKNGHKNLTKIDKKI